MFIARFVIAMLIVSGIEKLLPAHHPWWVAVIIALAIAAVFNAAFKAREQKE